MEAPHINYRLSQRSLLAIARSVSDPHEKAVCRWAAGIITESELECAFNDTYTPVYRVWMGIVERIASFGPDIAAEYAMGGRS